MGYPGQECRVVKLQESAGPENTVLQTSCGSRTWPHGLPHRRASVSAFAQIHSVPNGGKFCPRGLMSLSLDLRVMVFFPTQLMPSIRDLKEDHKGRREIPLLSPGKPRHRIPRAVRSQVPPPGEPVDEQLWKSANNQDFSLPDP